MDERARLITRGWREVEPARWANADLDRVGALPVAEVVAIAHRRETDAEQAREHGSVTYRPTAEQAQASPLLAACAAAGMTERDVIEHLHRRIQSMERDLMMLAANTGNPVRLIVEPPK